MRHNVSVLTWPGHDVLDLRVLAVWHLTREDAVRAHRVESLAVDGLLTLVGAGAGVLLRWQGALDCHRGLEQFTLLLGSCEVTSWGTIANRVMVRVVDSWSNRVRLVPSIGILVGLLTWDGRWLAVWLAGLVSVLLGVVLVTTLIKIRRQSSELERLEVGSGAGVADVGWWGVDAGTWCRRTETWDLQTITGSETYVLNLPWS